MDNTLLIIGSLFATNNKLVLVIYDQRFGYRRKTCYCNHLNCAAESRPWRNISCLSRMLLVCQQFCSQLVLLFLAVKSMILCISIDVSVTALVCCLVFGGDINRFLLKINCIHLEDGLLDCNFRVQTSFSHYHFSWNLGEVNVFSYSTHMYVPHLAWSISLQCLRLKFQLELYFPSCCTL